MAAMKKQTALAQEVASVIQKVQQAEKTSNIYTEEQRTALEEARSCIERLVTEYNKVQEDRDVTQQEAFASTEFYEEGRRRDKEYIRDLEAKLQEKEEYITCIQIEWEEKTKQQISTLAKEKSEIVHQLHAVQDELQSLHKFRTCQIEIEEELKKGKERLIEQQEKEKNNLVELERKYMEQGNHLKRDYEKSLAEIHAQLEKEIEEHVGTKIMHILQDNERLQEELRMHVEVTNGLQKEKSALQLEAAKLARDVDLLRQAETLHLQRSSTQARCISGNSNKLQKLEKSLGQVIRQYSAERMEIEEEHKKQTAALQAEKQTLKRLAQTKIHELRKVRQLAQQMLKERGEVESFLIESLHHVMEHIQTSKNNSKKAPLNNMSSRGAVQVTRMALPMSSLSTSSSHRFATASAGASPPSSLIRCKTSPQLLSTGKTSSQEALVSKSNVETTPINIMHSLKQVPVRLFGNPKVDISQLTWEDREKVLRYLFQKIHSSQSQTMASAAADDAAYPSHHSGYDLLYKSLTNDDDILGIS